MARGKVSPIHPGEILSQEFLQPLGVSQYRLAKDIGVPPRRISEIVHCRRAVTADTALRLSRYFGTTETFWMNLQAHYELEVQKDRLGDRLRREIVAYRPPRAATLAEPSRTDEPLRQTGRKARV
jgi:addiction module HigA family antidote